MAEHMAQQNAEGSRDLSTLVDASAELQHLVQTIWRLRQPDGCPWDLQQTHESLRQYMLEEAHEVVAAINEGDPDRIADELGDVLLQVVFHTEIEREAGRFTVGDVTDGIVKKLIYRHPHIFADTAAETADRVLENWDALKAKEKHRDTVTSSMRAVPRPLPALMRADKVGKRAAKVGFDFATARDAAVKIAEETDEVLTATDATRAEEVGDLLFAAVNVARKCGVDPEKALSDATDKFINRFEAVENAVRADGKTMENLPLSALDAYWDRVKAAGNGENT